MKKVTPFLSFDGQAEEAARFYVSLLPDSRIDQVTRSPVDTPGGAAGTVLIVEFTLAGTPFIALNTPGFSFTEAVSFQIDWADQAETDRLWAALTTDGGSEIACGWLKDRWGVFWQVTPIRLMELIKDPDRDRARRAMEAMMKMTKTNIAEVEHAADAKSTVAQAAELIILSSNASRTAVSELGPLFEKTSGRKVSIHFANNPILKQQVEAGAKFDVLIIEPEMLDDLAKQGKIFAGSRSDVARVGMALLARADAPKADVSTIDGFKTVLRNAESVAYTADGYSGTVFLRTLERVGLLQEMKLKLRPVVGKPVQPMVASGDVQMSAGPISTPTPGTASVGRFPEEIQTYIGISAGISAAAATPDVARSFIRFLTSPEAMAVFSKKGFQPMLAR